MSKSFTIQIDETELRLMLTNYLRYGLIQDTLEPQICAYTIEKYAKLLGEGYLVVIINSIEGEIVQSNRPYGRTMNCQSVWEKLADNLSKQLDN